MKELQTFLNDSQMKKQALKLMAIAIDKYEVSNLNEIYAI